MINPKLPEPLWAQLDSRLWHATNLYGVTSILADHCIRVSTGERYENSICRRMGCVSLFDFGPESLDQSDFESGNWSRWLVGEDNERCTIWLEIDRQQSLERLISPLALLARVRAERLLGKFFCGVEACHRGAIPTNAIAGGLIIDRHDLSSFRWHGGNVDGLPDAMASFAKSLPPRPPENPLVRALREARRAPQSN